MCIQTKKEKGNNRQENMNLKKNSFLFSNIFSWFKRKVFFFLILSSTSPVGSRRPRSHELNGRKKNPRTRGQAEQQQLFSSPTYSLEFFSFIPGSSSFTTGFFVAFSFIGKVKTSQETHSIVLFLSSFSLFLLQFFELVASLLYLILESVSFVTALSCAFFRVLFLLQCPSLVFNSRCSFQRSLVGQEKRTSSLSSSSSARHTRLRPQALIIIGITIAIAIIIFGFFFLYLFG